MCQNQKTCKNYGQKSNNLQLRSPNSSESVQMHYTAGVYDITGRINCPEGYHGRFLSTPWKKGTGCSPRIVTTPSWGNSLQHRHPKHKSTPLTSIHLHISHWWPWKGPVLEPQLPLAQYKSSPSSPSGDLIGHIMSDLATQLTLPSSQPLEHSPEPDAVTLKMKAEHSHKMLGKNLLHCVTPHPCCTPPPPKKKSH